MQKQEATILSAELSGFQSLAESLSPEEITPLMSKIHALVENTVRLHQGKINRYTGDTFLAIFHTSGTAAKNALDVAFELRDQLKSFISDKKLEQPLNLKLGIASGWIIETDIGIEQKQQTLMGEAVNHATRISRFAGEGQILSDDKTLEGLTDDFDFQKLEPIPLKRGTETLPVFELLELKRKKLDLKVSGERKIASEMVGRSREMKQLENLFKQLLAGKGSVVNIVGRAGIGKSRLMDEMKVQPVMEKVVMLEGRALLAGKNLSFHPIISLIKSWSGISEDDLPSVSSEKLLNGIKQIAPEQADEIYAFLATMMGLPLEGKYKERVKGIDGEALEKLILKNLRDLIISETEDKPRIYLIEDMHWSDSSSITLFESLYKLSQNHPVMFINVMRPGYKETGDYILKYLVDNFPGDNTTININPLEEIESGNLIINLLRETTLPNEIQSMIIRKTEGNPFFIEEIIRSFIDEGIIEVKDGNFIVTDKINNANIPETINEAILSRVDKLDEKTRELLNTASVMGRNFYYKVLEEATDTIEELDDRLAYLSEVQLISESKKKQEIEFLFKHALAQQLTYDSIIQKSRKDLHSKIAKSIEKVFAENLNEFYGTLAYHYEKADNSGKTETYLIKAGDQALNSGASSEALSFLKDALNICLKQPHANLNEEKIIDIHYKISLAYNAIGSHKEAIEFFDRFLAFYGFKFPSNKMVKFLGFIYFISYYIFCIYFPKLFFKKTPTDISDNILLVFSHRGKAMGTTDPFRTFIETFYYTRILSKYQLRDSGIGVGLLSEISLMFFWTGISMKIGRKVQNLVKEKISNHNSSSWIRYRFSKIMLDFLDGEWEKDKDCAEVINTAMKAGSVFEATIYTLFVGFKAVEKGRYLDAKDAMDKLITISEYFENSHALAQYYRLAGRIFNKFRKIDESIAITEEGLKYTHNTYHIAMLLAIYCNRSISFSLKRNLGEAEKSLKYAGELVDDRKRVKIFYSTYLLAVAHFELAKLQLKADQIKVTKDHYTVALKASRNLIKNSKMVAGNIIEAYRILGLVYCISNNPLKSLKSFKNSIDLGEKYDGRLELSRAYFDTGKFLSDPNNKYNELNGNSASYYLEKAKSMFEEMDLQWDLEEYRKFIEN